MPNNNQDTTNFFASFIDNLQDIIGIISPIIPGPIADKIDTVNTLIDIRQEIDQNTGMPSWKITVATIAGNAAGGSVIAVGEFTTRAAALTALAAGGPVGWAGSAAIFYNGSVVTIKAGNAAQQLTHDETLALLNSPGFIEAENYANNWAHDLMDSIVDVLGKTTGWSQEPVWLNNLLKGYDATLFGARDLEDYLKDKLSSLLSDAQTIGSPILDFLHNLTIAEATPPPVIRRDPLTLDLNHNGTIDLVSLNNSTAFFDLDDDTLREKVGWIKPTDGLLVLDENNNGIVDNINELFGHSNEDGTQTTGTQELATHDSNSDGKIDSSDSVFSQLKVWQDLDQDGFFRQKNANSIFRKNENSATPNLGHESSWSEANKSDEVLKHSEQEIFLANSDEALVKPINDNSANQHLSFISSIKSY